ncbi:MAG: cupin domain-containing protein [Saprospiraceae bacterium]|nr:cupin domain-containing protein [Saprospiraceae bacterium]
MKISPQVALNKIDSIDKKFYELFTHGSLVVQIYRPKKVDLQTPHTRDEIYVIISGSGKFFNNGKTMDFGPGDFLFVKAGHHHQFESFTEDFATWVFFYGPEGGE